MERMRVIVAALALGLLAEPFATADAQQAPRIARIGYLGSPASVPHNVNAFLEGLREIGYLLASTCFASTPRRGCSSRSERAGRPPPSARPTSTRSSKALGLTIPQSVLLRADEILR